MTIDTFLDALQGCAAIQRFGWRTTEDMGFLHGWWGWEEHCPVSALAWCWGWRPQGDVDPSMLWDQAAEVLGLSLEDASEIVSAADADMRHDPALRKVLLGVLGVEEEPAEQERR